MNSNSNTTPEEIFPDDSKSTKEKLPDHMESPLKDINSKKEITGKGKVKYNT